MSAVENAVSAVVEVPKKVIGIWQRPIFWLGAIALIVLLIVAVMYVASLREYALAKLMARSITAGGDAAPTAMADQPAQPEPVSLNTQL